MSDHPKYAFEETIEYEKIELPTGEVTQLIPVSHTFKILDILKEIENKLYTGSSSFTEESEWDGLESMTTYSYKPTPPGLTTTVGGWSGTTNNLKYSSATTDYYTQPAFNLPGDDEDTPAMNNTDALFTSKADDWCTPQEIVDMLSFLGHIRLDPCSNPNSLVPAQFKYDLREGFDGLEQPWDLDGMRTVFGPGVKPGYVYVNPPYGKTISQWTQKAIKASQAGADVVMLVPARTDTKWWQEVIGETNAVCFLKGRLTFKDAPSSAPFPSALLYFGPMSLTFCTNLSSKGWTVSQ